MALVYADRVKETSVTTGTGTYNLNGTVTGYRTFVAGIGNANTCFYCAENGIDWEVGLGTVTDAAPDTLARTTILASSNGGAAVDWAAGTKTVFCTAPALVLGMLVGNGQIKFPATQNASSDPNELDDYEEGTWTPTLTFETPGNLSVVYSIRTGIYIKIGKLVYLQFSIVTSTFTHTTAAGNMTVTGLPFTSQNTASSENDGALSWAGITKANYTQICTLLAANTALFLFRASGSAQNSAAIAFGDTPSGGTILLHQTITYAATA